VAPTVVNVGTVASGTTTCTPAFPASILANDILITIAESVGGQNYATPSLWAHVGPNGGLSSPVVQSTNTQLTMFWRRYDGTGAAPALTGTTDHCLARMIAVRGCPTVGNPWNIGSVTTEALSDTTAVWPTATTTQDDTLVVLGIASSADPVSAGTAEIGAVTNAALTSITERVDNGDPTGNGGVIGLVTGIKATAGAIGTSSMTLTTAGFKSFITMALMNVPPPRPPWPPRRARSHPSFRR
jgi:hypothetical protein